MTAQTVQAPEVTVVEEWRVTGDPGEGYPPYDHTWRTDRDNDPWGNTAESKARRFIAEQTGPWSPHARPWEEGPHLHHRTITTTPWEPA